MSAITKSLFHKLLNFNPCFRDEWKGKKIIPLCAGQSSWQGHSGARFSAWGNWRPHGSLLKPCQVSDGLRFVGGVIGSAYAERAFHSIAPPEDCRHSGEEEGGEVKAVHCMEKNLIAPFSDQHRY